MKKSGNEKNQPKKEPGSASGKAKSKGKTAKELMTRHFSNENDVISDEDFKNLNIDIDISADVAHQPLDIPDNPNRPKDEDKDPKITTSWDVIS